MTRRVILAALLALSLAGSAEAAMTQGFLTIASVFDEGPWTWFTQNRTHDLEPRMLADLRSPKQILFIYNAWSLATMMPDPRVGEIERSVLRPQAVLDDTWPEYQRPGYVALVETANGDWALITEMRTHLIVEYHLRVGAVRKLPRVGAH